MVERHQAGETLAAIANSMDRSIYTVRKWWRAYRDQGWAGLEPKDKGPPQVGALGRFDPMVKYVALRLKRQHLGWGTPMLRLHMKRQASLANLAIPGDTALWQYLKQFGDRLLQAKRLPTKRPQSETPKRGQRPHECWEMDFKGDEQVGGCNSVVAPFAVSDEASGAPLARIIHQLRAKGNRRGLTVRTVQADLRQVFRQWGLPDALRMDRDPLFVGSGRLEWPGTLLLWLVGLGVQPIINRAYRPTDNALVERSHRTWKNDVLVGSHHVDLVALQCFSDQTLEDRRCRLPSRRGNNRGLPPILAFPDLTKTRRPYALDQESSLFRLQRVDAYLAKWEWRRKVDTTGRISMADKNYPVGSSYRGKIVKIHFDPKTREFVSTNMDKQEITRFQVQEVSRDFILGQGVRLKRIPSGGRLM
jgi:transposase InsO family protein